MTNLKREPVRYQQFKGHAILADGLLAVARPGGEVERSIATSLFSAADTFQASADRTAQSRAAAAYESSTLAIPGLKITGGDKHAVIQYGDSATQIRGTPEVRDAISRAAAKHGVSAGVLMRFAQIESSLNPKQKNPNSSAGGLFQLIDTTAAQYGVTDKFDVNQSADAGARLTRDNTDYLRKKLGRDPTVGELYLAHQQGGAGALRLLQNPNAPAASIVGRDAVIGNGGAADMSAGDFARMWTTKAGDAPVGEGLGPITVRDPLKIEATGGLPKLTGRDTIFGRAYDEAVTRSYKDQLSDEMLTASRQLFEKYQDSPEELRVAFSDLKREQLANHVPPSIRADYELGFAKLERTFLADAQQGREKTIETDAHTAWSARDADYVNSISRAEAGLKASNPESFDILQGEVARRKAHFGEAVARGWMTPQAATEAVNNLDGDVAVAFHLKQAEGKTEEEIKALRDTMKADYAAGKLEGIDAPAWGKLDAGLKQLGTDVVTSTRSARASLQVAMNDDISSLTKTGKVVPYEGRALDFDTVKKIMGEADALKWQQDRAEAQGQFAAVTGLEKMTPEAIAARLADVEPPAGSANYAMNEKISLATIAKAKTILDLRKSDPATAVEQAFPEVKALAVAGDKSPAAQGNLIAARLHAQDVLGIPELAQSPLTNAEATQLADHLTLNEGDDAALMASMNTLMIDAQNTYGVHADEVMAQVLQVRGVDRATAAMGIGIMNSMGLGNVPPRANLQDFERLQAAAQADAAMSGEPVNKPRLQFGGRYGSEAAKPAKKPSGPNARQVQLLRSNPALAGDFDKKFGKGSADGFLNAPKGDSTMLHLPDGSTEIRYEDGWTEILHADGTVEGKAGS